MTPVRLNKVEPNNKKFSDKVWTQIEEWVLSHSLLCLFILMSLLISLFVVLIFTLVGVSATESGAVYNQFSNIV